MTTLTRGQWSAIAVLVATHGHNPELEKAVEAELAKAREQAPPTNEDETKEAVNE